MVEIKLVLHFLDNTSLPERYCHTYFGREVYEPSGEVGKNDVCGIPQRKLRVLVWKLVRADRRVADSGS
jgi:hypothetical protein